MPLDNSLFLPPQNTPVIYDEARAQAFALLVGAGLSLTRNPNDVTLASTGGGGISAPVVFPTTTVTGNLAVPSTACVIFSSPSANNFIQLPAPPAVVDGQIFIVKKINNNAAVTQVSAAGGIQIQGTGNVNLNTNFGSATFMFSTFANQYMLIGPLV
jgi:hypothetical protein